MDQVLVRRGHPRPAGRVPGRAARQGRDGRGDRRAGRRDAARTPAGSTVPGRAVDVVGHRRRPGAHRQHLDDGGASSSPAAGRAGGQARQPGGVVGQRVPPTCWRRSASRSTCRPTRSPRCVAEVGIGFCFAPVFHPAMRHAGPVAPRAGRADRDERARPADQPGPAGRRRWSAARTARLAPVHGRGVRAAAARRVLVVRGDDGLDELTTTTTSTVWVVGGGEVRERDARPGGARHAPRRPARTCAAATRGAQRRRCSGALLAGEPGPVRDAVLLNAAGALAALDGVGGRAARRPGRRVRRGARARARRGDRLRSGGASCSTRWVEVVAPALRRLIRGLRVRRARLRSRPMENAASVSALRVRAERDVGVGAPHARRPC